MKKEIKVVKWGTSKILEKNKIMVLKKFKYFFLVSMNTNMMEAMGGNGALGKRRRKKRANNLIEKVNFRIGRKTSNSSEKVNSRIGQKTFNLTKKDESRIVRKTSNLFKNVDQNDETREKISLSDIYFEKLKKKFLELDDCSP